MSKTRCRFCHLVFQGLYMNCPKCGKWLMPQSVAPGKDIHPENDDYEILESTGYQNGKTNTTTE